MSFFYECKACSTEIVDDGPGLRTLYCAECGAALTKKVDGKTAGIAFPPGRIGGTLLDMSVPDDLKKKDPDRKK